jgi:ATP-binding cassette subfamily B protein
MRAYLRTLTYFRREWPLIGLLLALIGVSIGVGLAQAWPTAVLIDAVLTPTPSKAFIDRLFLAPLPANRLGQAIGITIIMMFLKVAQDGLTFLKSIVNRKIEFGGLIRVRSELFRHLHRLGPDYHKRSSQGDTIYRMTFDANGFKDVLNVLINTGCSAVRLAMMVAVMATRSVSLTVVALSIFPALILINRKCGPHLRRRSAESKVQDAEYTTVLQQAMSVIGLTQAFGRERRAFGRFKASNRSAARGWTSLNNATEAYWFLVRSAFSLGTALMYGYGGYLIYRDQFVLHRGDAGVRVGDLLVFMACVNDLWTPLQDLISFTANIQPPMAAVERVWAVLDRTPAVADPAGDRRLPRRRRELTFENVRFTHPAADRPALADVSVDVAPGQLVAFVGSSGAGKSTLLNLINRMADPTHGRVLLDGHDVRDVRLADVRRHVALVPQDGQVIASLTIAQNIAYGRTGATIHDVRRAAALAGADDFIDDLPDGYDTVVAEGGANLSGGQRQRLAIARAVLSDAPVLVLDEPTSALDPHHAKQVMRAVHGLRRRRTVVLVTHDLSSVAGCDQIFVLDAGRLAERGTHDELLERDGVYAALLAEATASHARPAAITVAA